MAIYSSTLIIKGNLNVSDSKLLKLLELDKPVTSYDRHKVGKENTTYDEIIANLSINGDDVYVCSKDSFTIIVSFALIDDYSRSIGLIKNRVENLFPKCEYFFFFSETISMLNGFVWGIGRQILRKKYVQYAKYMEVYDHIMDLGELLPVESEFYPNKNDQVDGFPIKNNDYMSGANDFIIASTFIENHFQIKSLVEFLSELTFNKNVNSELSQEELDLINNRLQGSEIAPEILNAIKPLMKTLKFKKIDFKEDGQSKKSLGFYKLIGDERRIVVEVSSSSFYGANSASLNLYFKSNKDLYRDIVEKIFSRNAMGIKLFSIDFTFELCKLNNTVVASINNRKELRYLIDKVESELININAIIEKASIQNFEELFSDENYFKYSLKKLNELIEIRQFIYPNASLNYCLVYYCLNKNQIVADEIMQLIDFECKNDLVKSRHDKTSKMIKEVIMNN